MRLIAGTARGMALQVPKTEARPSTDRVRGALFSILADRVEQARVLDLFAGSGALGLEALSRGAKSATFIEQQRTAAEVIRKNAEKARLAPVCDVRVAEVLSWLKSTGRFAPTYDLIFADPPYRKTLQDPDYGAALLTHPDLPGLLAPGGLFVLERLADRSQLLVPSAWNLIDQRSYGLSQIVFLEKAPNL
jgi:16S rRNA (guanine966-N2)-methyltransferase